MVKFCEIERERKKDENNEKKEALRRVISKDINSS
jgi:hypothetical protein